KSKCKFNHKDPDKIKNPATEESGWKGSFRCDGFVEYCYEQVVPGGFFTDEEERDCWSSLLDKEYDEGVWPTFYPKALMKRMQKAEKIPPQILSFKLYKGTEEIKEGGLLKKDDVVTIKTFVTDEDEGSGIDRVDLYYQEVYGQLLGKGTLTLITTLDDDEDIEKEYNYDWTVPSTTITFLDCEVSAVAYDRAGNTIGTVGKFWTGSPYHVKEPFRVIIDNVPPTVVRSIPANGQTKVYLGNRIRITFSEQMATETINADTILLNNGAVVGSVSYNPDIKTAFFTPTQPLNIGTNYTILVKGGQTGVKDEAGNPLVTDYTSSFTTVTDLIPGKVTA
ncbi:MAG: Ig-like domain-containing protein, partial [bacterium]